MEISRNKNISYLNAFKFETYCDFYAEIKSENDLIELWKIIYNYESVYFLGQWSNTFFSQNYSWLIVHNMIQGDIVETQNWDKILLTVTAWQDWHNLVDFCVHKWYWGIENLAYIPWAVGSAPIQNIWAYWVEIKDVIVSVRGYNLKTQTFEELHNEQCQFAYRDSVFKNKLKGYFFITSITIQLSTTPQPKTHYQWVAQYLQEHDLTESLENIYNAIIQIRKSKLPDHTQIGTAWSFFKNPIISTQRYEELKSRFTEIPSFSYLPWFVKVPAGWLIDYCGLKGYMIWSTWVSPSHALVLIHRGGWQSGDLKKVYEHIQNVVQEKFDIFLEPEVNIL